MTAAPTEDYRAVALLDLNDYFRQERGMIRKEARYYSRQVYRDESLSAQLLPPGWHRAIWPTGDQREGKSTFTRRNPGISDPTPQAAFRRSETRAILERMAAGGDSSND